MDDNTGYQFLNFKDNFHVLNEALKAAEIKISNTERALRFAEAEIRGTQHALQLAEKKVVITEFVLKEVSRLRISAGEECVVCFEPFETCTTFQCGHSFCEPCAAQLQSKCAVCRLKSAWS